MNILFEGFFYSGNGYAEGNRVLLRILSNLGHHVRIKPKDKKRDKALTQKEIDYLNSFEHTKLAVKDMYISRDSGYKLEHNSDYRVNIAHTTFETDRIPASWVPKLNKFDEVWVQCKFNQENFKAAGVKVPIRFIPYFFENSGYVPKGDKYPLPTAGKVKFHFLSVFDLRKRKGYDILLKAFLNEFSARDKAALVIKIRNRKATDKLLHIIDNHPKPKENHPTIHIIDRMLITPQLRSLYRACDAFVLPTRGEGWGRPFFEAMLMEMPVIATDWSGQREYMNSHNSYPIRVKKLVPVRETDRRDRKKYDGHYWAEPSMTDLQKKMRYVLEHQNMAQKVGKKARAELLERYSMRKVAKRVAKEIDKFK